MISLSFLFFVFSLRHIDEDQRLSLSFERKFPSRIFLMRCVNVQCLFSLIGAPRHLHKCQSTKEDQFDFDFSSLEDYSFIHRSVNQHDGIVVVVHRQIATVQCSLW